METRSYKPGDLIVALAHHPEGLAVLNGEVGYIVEWPIDHPAVKDHKDAGYICVEFKVGRNIKGLFGETIGVVRPHHISHRYSDNDLFEDDI